MSKWWLNVDSNYTTCLIWLRVNTGWVEHVESYYKLDIEHHSIIEEVTHLNHIYNYWLVYIDFKKHKLWNTESANMATRVVVYVRETVLQTNQTWFCSRTLACITVWWNCHEKDREWGKESNNLVKSAD